MTQTQKRRVVVTGMGVISSVGYTLDQLWNNLVEGNSGIGLLECIPTDEIACKIGAECKDFAPENYMDKKDARRMDRYTQLGMAASRLAYDDSKLNGSVVPERMGTIISTGAGGIHTIEEYHTKGIQKGWGKTSPFFIPMMLCDSAAGRVSIEFNAKGPSESVSTACASGASAVGNAFRMIRDDEVDVMIAGGAEAPITVLAVDGFAAARALSLRNDDPKTASRPFEKGRDGFVMAEGSAVLILEEMEHAKKRGARIYGEVIGYGRTADANDIVSPPSDGEGAARSMRAALRDAGVTPDQIQYVNAHGTSTPVGDVAETIAVKSVFGEHATNGLRVSSTKSMTGHLLGAAGSLEAIISLLAIKNKMIPPTINLEDPDDQCDLDYVPKTARKADDLKMAMSNSFGFGGHNATLIFQEFSDN
ncbi:MAG: beta-ketoacyl-ACP synthase II [Vampirovibrio sp.]|nr:beta-ketoacyl-ACP synthase II [Vampirovibrio sp.]